ncbi:MAG TPA: hypothetical protein VFV64_04185 [Permianibacter sp.]|nr:hypothetical protein [Permianibacter sp.]
MKRRHVWLTLCTALAAISFWQYQIAPSQAGSDTATANTSQLATDAAQAPLPANRSYTVATAATPTPVNTSSAANDKVSEDVLISEATTLAEYEKQFFSGDSLRIDKLLAATEAEQFAGLFHALDSLAVDPAVRMRTQQLTEALRSLPALQAGTISLQRFACGTRFCAASFLSQDETAWEQFRNALSGQLELPDGGVSFDSHSGQQGDWERRLVFSTDGNQTGGIVLQTNSAVTLVPADD